MSTDLFHDGERALQAAVGMHERMAAVGPKVIRDFMLDQHRELFGKLPTMFVGVLGEDGQPWATLVHGAPGFIQTPDAQTMQLAARLDPGDPAAASVRVGASIGLLGLEPHTRRRNRANGVVEALEPAWSVKIRQSYGNCPKYIHGREPSHCDRIAAPASVEGSCLSAHARELVTRSDTMFIASSSAGVIDSSAASGVDVSHRGGLAGFVAISREAEADVLTIPDYLGNFMFNTLGNLLAWPRAGLLFVDWTDGHVLQLAATARLDTTERLLHLTVLGGWWRPSAVPLTWSAPVPPSQFSAR